MPKELTELETKTLEKRLRRQATTKGLALRKSRDGQSIDNQGGYMIVDPYRNAVVDGDRFNLSLTDVEAYLSNEK